MKFIVSYEDTEVAKDALKEAQKHAKAWGASLEVIHVIEREIPIKRSKLEEMEAEYEAAVRDLFKGLDIDYKMQLQVDDINKGEEIVRLAKRKKADMIFIGIKRRSKVGKIIFGSTVRYVILEAPCPVVTVNKKYGERLNFFK